MTCRITIILWVVMRILEIGMTFLLPGLLVCI